LAVAALLHVGVTIPGRAEATRIVEELARQSEARRSARVRLTALERREAARRRTATSVVSPEEAPAALRQEALASLQGSRCKGVRLEVRPAKAPLGATLHVTAEGASEDVVRLAGRLAGPGTGVYLSNVRFSIARQGALALEVEAFSLGARP
jgi:hypothetical protein